MSFTRFVALAASALVLTAGAAEAKTLKALVNANGQAFGGAGGIVQLAPGVNSTTFTAPAAGTYVVNYTAECKVADVGKYLTIAVVVDGTERSPTSGLDDGFCASNTTAAADGPAMYSVAVPVNLSAGVHSVLIRAAFPLGGAGGTLDDSTTIITD